MNEAKALLHLSVSLSDLLESLSTLDSAELHQFICDLDALQADYDFTLKLRDHFIAEMAACDAADAKMTGKAA